jgi:hypothetical protein
LERSECLDDCIGTTSNVILHLICLKNNFYCILRIVFAGGSTLMILLLVFQCSSVQQFGCNMISTEQFTTLELFWSVCNLFFLIWDVMILYLLVVSFSVSSILDDIKYFIVFPYHLVQIEWSSYPKFVVSFFAVWISRGHIKKWGISQC